MISKLSRFIFPLSILILTGAAYAQTAEPVVTPWTAPGERTYEARAVDGNINPAASTDAAAKTPGDDAQQTDEDQPAAKPAKPALIAQQTTVVTTYKELAPSPLEQMYSARANQKLSQYGYDLFGVPAADTQGKLDSAAAANSQPPMGETQDDFVLSAGDDVQVTFTGQRSFQKTYRIDSNGLLMIPDLPPIPAAGRAIGEVRVSLQSAAAELHNTKTYLALASVRQIGVLVVGHIRRPGRETLTVFHTVLDALMQAGGVDKTGSLRQIRLVREGRSSPVDLYDLLLKGAPNVDLRLHDGDRIIVPAIGPTVAVSGAVKRPGVYEILPDMQGMDSQPDQKAQKLSLNDMLELGGGALVPGKNRYLRMSVTPQGEEKVEESRDSFAPVFGDGSMLMVGKGDEKRTGQVDLEGATLRPGPHALSDSSTLSKLINSQDVLGPDVYPLIGVIERWDADELATKYVDFPLRLVLKGSYDSRLADGDVVRLFTMDQIRSLNENDADKPLKTNLRKKDKTGKDAAAKDEDAQNAAPDIADNAAPEDAIKPLAKSEPLKPAMINFLREHCAFLRGAAQEPGAYPVSEGESLDSVIAAAGGLAIEANTSNIEVTGPSGRTHIDFLNTNPREVMISPGDSIRINQKFDKPEDKSVYIIGEVLNPGHYDLLRGDKVSDLLRRAGGLTPQAYSDGAIFSRESERLAEEARYHAEAADMRRAISAAVAQDDKKVDSAKLEDAQSLADQLDHAQGVGRITVSADPAELAAHPELDMLLESGDRIYIPKRALTVRVSGEVLSPATLQFRKTKTPADYIAEAGGFSYNADKTRAFVLYPDGSAQPLNISMWHHDSDALIPPGSSIIVPLDPKPFDFLDTAKDVSQILSNLAVTAIFADDIRRDN